MINPHVNNLSGYPFDRLRELLDGILPPDGLAPLALSIGEPKHVPPALIKETLDAKPEGWGRYPPIDGTPEFRAAVHGWLGRRFALDADFIDADSQILPVVGTREALFLAAMLCVPQELAVPENKNGVRPAVLFPNPMYHVYSGAAEMSGAEPVAMDASSESDFLPDLDALDDATLTRTALMYLCSPSNPEGAVADADYLRRVLGLARKHDFILAMDECYSEIYDAAPPTGMAEICAETGAMKNVLLFHSLSKRSSAPGLRSGFVCGDTGLIERFRYLRNFGAATLSLPIVAVSTELWNDDAHVAENRALYQAKFDIAEELLQGRFGFRRPPGGFFLWLDMAAHGGGVAAARKLWAEAALRVLPGAYLSKAGSDGTSPGDDFIRVALVHPPEVTREALERLVKVFR